jgi:hypothetical protein
MKPANQNNMVRTSATRIPNLCAAVGYLAGAMIRYMSARSVQAAVKIRKLIWEGDHHQAQLLAAVKSLLEV